jgi:glycosyltransferase involved in cell wall biosynthesis
MDVATAPYPALDHFYFSPLKVYEYMAAGVCVVASRVGQLAELIRDDSNGVLYSPGDVEALVVSLRQLRADPERRERLGAAGRATVIGAHTWDSVAARMLELAGVDVEWSS